jgi:hypothetical protein
VHIWSGIEGAGCLASRSRECRDGPKARSTVSAVIDICLGLLGEHGVTLAGWWGATYRQSRSCPRGWSRGDPSRTAARRHGKRCLPRNLAKARKFRESAHYVEAEMQSCASLASRFNKGGKRAGMARPNNPPADRLVHPPPQLVKSLTWL